MDLKATHSIEKYKGEKLLIWERIIRIFFGTIYFLDLLFKLIVLGNLYTSPFKSIAIIILVFFLVAIALCYFRLYLIKNDKEGKHRNLLEDREIKKPFLKKLYKIMQFLTLDPLFIYYYTAFAPEASPKFDFYLIHIANSRKL
jgi:hypothetical protein